MKTRLQINTKEITSKGHPIYLHIVDGKKRFKKAVFHSEIQNWDSKNQLLLPGHPNYDELVADVLNLKSKIISVNIGDYDFESAKRFILEISSEISFGFFDAGMKLVNGSTNTKLYATVLRSFDMYYPGIRIDEISAGIAKSYMAKLLLRNSSNGVHTYMRTLTTVFAKLSEIDNPFKGIRPRLTKTASKDLTVNDVIKLETTRTFKSRYDGKNTNETINYYRYYWLLMFYLGGIDFEALARLRYDKHVVNGRIQFNRQKGGSSVYVDNIIVDQAKDILKQFNCYPYLVPIFKYNYREFVSNYNNRFHLLVKDLELTKKPVTKSARYTFINFAQDKFIDERITMEIVGHEQKTTHSIYKRAVPRTIKDNAHMQIVDLHIDTVY